MCYFSNAFAKPQITVDAICRALDDPKFDRTDFIVGSGVSGTLMLVPVSLRSGIPYGVVRKSLDATQSYREGGCHSDREVESRWTPDNCVNGYIIIDDLIDSGETIKKIIQAMREKHTRSRCAGIILYQNFLNMENGDWEGIPLTCLSNDIKERESDEHKNSSQC